MRGASQGPVAREYVFVDESGDPGPDGNPVYILVGMHFDEDVLDRVRRHLAAFRYHNDVVREMKVQRWADKLTPTTLHLLRYLADLTDAGEIITTANWLHKGTYRANRGPHLHGAGHTSEFRHYQLRRLLERHRGRATWSTETDLVLDRWRMTLEQRGNLEEYLRNNYSLRPRLAYVTLVDSQYCDPIQIVDIFGRLARRVVETRASTEEQNLAKRLMDIAEVRGGLY